MTSSTERADRLRAVTITGIAGLAVAAVAVAGLVAFAVPRGGSGSNGGVVPPPAPATPSAPPVATPTPQTPRPSATPIGDPAPIRVVVRTASRAHDTLDISDTTGLLAAAESGTPGEGVSVDERTLAVRNLDPSTLALTWSDYPHDNELSLVIDRFDGRLRLLLARPAPTGTTDAIALDRELVLHLAEPVDAADVEAIVQEGFDTPG